MTVPLIILLVLQVLGILFLPLILPFLSAILNSASVNTDTANSLSPTDLHTILTFVSASIWVVEIVQVGVAVLYFFTLRAVQQGKSWGRIVAIVMFILGLLNFPVGTLLGVFGLIGAFDQEVTAYCSR
ncbi:hypothetical protein MF271_13955 [Deinococcus sp. KNUC1210]|uniref:hypothetical protein n=1 Tax=Deinococcus sp. KNUC1210 TaxID=2917691 RepID=UPI001EEFF1B3|nr:hypothetical protein [Deinococcus sp. KNUC1210]ULH15051.1 hypothetical protein MF271_13955 [Deinococcus sp. KNUC1210]